MPGKLWHVLLGLSLVMVMWGTCSADNGFTSSPMGETMWGPSREEWKLTREDALAKYNYCPTGGCVVRLESVELKPLHARKGETISMTTSYTILTPEALAIPVTISREIFYQGKSLGKTKSLETRNRNGTWNQKIDFSLPAIAAPGIYTLITRVSTGYGWDEQSVQFTVN